MDNHDSGLVGSLITASMSGTIYLGEFTKAAGSIIPVLDKATGERLFESVDAAAADVVRAAETAKSAQPAWAACAPTERGDVLRRFAALCEKHAEEVGRWIVRETGSIPPKAPFEILTSAREALEVAGLTGQPVGHILASVKTRASYARRMPLGVVGVITPWNAPFILAARVVLPALATGNAVVLKPDIQTPVCGGYALAKLFELAGLPKGLLCVVPGGAAAGEALTADRNINMISFTGSTAVGRKVASSAGASLKKVALELGGNNAAIVFDDADLDAVTAATAFGSFFHQGQICFSTGRHLVQKSIARQYVDKLVARVKNLRVGDPNKTQVHLGPIINEKQAARVQELVDSGVQAGARVAIGGRRSGVFFEPTVLENITSNMSVYSEETFGPVASIVTFESDEEAVALANESSYGLVASIFTSNQARAFRIAAKLRTGIVHINDQTVNHEVFGPIGGTGTSGNGARSGGPSALDEYSQWQWLTVNETVPAYPF